VVENQDVRRYMGQQSGIGKSNMADGRHLEFKKKDSIWVGDWDSWNYECWLRSL